MQSQFELLTTQALKLTSDERESLVQFTRTPFWREPLWMSLSGS